MSEIGDCIHDRIISECPYDFCRIEVLESENAALKKELKDLHDQISRIREAMEILKEFNACMKAQHQDTQVPAGHDDADESCGDGVCYQVGRFIEEALATIPAEEETKL